MTSSFLHKKFIIRNGAAWLLLYLLFIIAQYLGSAKGDHTGYWQVTGSFIVEFVLFYGHFFLCDALFIRKKGWYFISLLSLLALYLLVIDRLINGDTSNVKDYAASQKTAIFIYFGLFFAITILLSGFYWSVLFAGKKIKENAQMQLALQGMENEKMLAEKKFLQLQINPHFLYNTLNFLYARSLHCSTELSDGIMTLSEIMRYSLQKNENAKGFVSLEDEVIHLKNIIHIHQLRFSGKLQINFTVEGSPQNTGIVPFVLITMVENALKHGDLNNTSFPVQIRLVCDDKRQEILFSVGNRKREGPKEASTGIGLENTISRLKWMYQDNYSFRVTNEPYYFTAELVLPYDKLYSN